MSFNTAALYGCHQPIPSSYQTRYEPLPPRRPRASTMTQDANTQWHRDAQRMPGLCATNDNSPPLIFNREYSFIWDDVNVQNDRVTAATEQESIDRKRARYDSVDRERRGRVSLDEPQEHPAFIDYERVRHASVERKRQRCESVDRERGRRASIDWRHDRERDMSIGRHGQCGSGSKTLPRPPVCAVSPKPPTTCPQSRPRRFESESVTVPRPPVCAVSFKPPTTGPQSRHRKSESESVVVSHLPACAVSSKSLTMGPQFRHRLSDSESIAFPRPPVCAVSFKPPTTGPQSRHPCRFSFDHATGHDHSGEHQHPVYDSPPTAPVSQIHMPTRRRTASVKAVRRLRFLKPEAPPLEKSKLSGLTRFNPFNRLRSATMSTSKKICRKTAGRA